MSSLMMSSTDTVRVARRRLEADLGRAGLALGEQRPRPLGDGGKLFRPVALQIFGHRRAEQLGKERAGNIASAPCQCGARQRAMSAWPALSSVVWGKSWTFMLPSRLVSAVHYDNTRTMRTSAIVAIAEMACGNGV